MLEHLLMNLHTKNSNPNILVVDDMAINLVLLKRVLERANYNVLTAEDGNEAIEIMQTGNVSLVLLDIRMPNLDGFGVLDKKREIETIKNIPVIMTSAFTENNIIEKSISKGAISYIKKPIDRRELIEKMSEILNPAFA